MFSWYCLPNKDMHLYSHSVKKSKDGRYVTPVCDSKVIGEGGFSEITQGTVIRKDGKFSFCKIPVALKTKHRRNVDYQSTIDEAKFLLKLKKVKFIVNVIGIRYNRKEFILGLELCNPQSISYFTDLFNDDTDRYYLVLYIGTAMISAIGALHKLNYVHCDIKCEHIVLSKTGVPKLIDFGLTSKLEDTAVEAGTYGYMAPEVKHNKASFKSDSFSLGITIGEMLLRERSEEYFGEYNLMYLRMHMSAEKYHDRLENSIFKYYKVDEESLNELPQELFKIISTELVLDFVQVNPENRGTILDKEELNIVQQALGLQPSDIDISLAEKIDQGIKVAKKKLYKLASRGLSTKYCYM